MDEGIQLSAEGAEAGQRADADVILVGCVRTKNAVASSASELFSSPLFAGRRRYAVASGRRWYILSAKFGLLAPDDVIGPMTCTSLIRPRTTGGPGGSSSRPSWSSMSVSCAGGRLKYTLARPMWTHCGHRSPPAERCWSLLWPTCARANNSPGTTPPGPPGAHLCGRRRPPAGGRPRGQRS